MYFLFYLVMVSLCETCKKSEGQFFSYVETTREGRDVLLGGDGTMLMDKRRFLFSV